MVVFRPFRGCRYNPDVAGDMATVLCPPYDLIGAELKESLKQLSPYNAVHLEGGEQPDPVDPEGSYLQAATLFQEWLHQGVLRRDETPGFYLMRHGYQFRGQAKAHLGLFGDVQVDDYEQRSVLPHEFTREPAVLDRVALLDACKAQFSPIMSLYRDVEGALKPLLDEIMSAQPVVDVQDSTEGAISFWRIDDLETQQRITDCFAAMPIFLADGHHRYEAALRYRRQQAQATATTDNEAAHNYVTMALVEFDDPGLLLLPYHRVIGGLSDQQLIQIKGKLNELFEVQPVSLDPTQPIIDLLDQVETVGKNRHTLGVVEMGTRGPSLLALREEIDWQQWGPLAVSEAWVLEEKVIRPVLGDVTAQNVNYPHDHEEAVAQVTAGTQQLVFLLKPFPMETFEAIVGGGQRLPSKSTFFYPKLPTGLVINQLEGRL